MERSLSAGALALKVLAAFQCSGNRTEVGLRGEAGKGIERAVDRVTTGVDGGQHGRSGNAAGVVGMEVQRQADFFLQRLDQRADGARFADAGHVFDADDVGAGLLQLSGEVDVVLEVEFRAALVEQVAGVAQGAFAQRTALDDGIHGDTHVVHPVQRVEDTEDVDAVLSRLLHEVAHNVVAVVGIADGVGGAQQHLEKDVRHLLAQALQAFPGVFLEKAQSNVEGGAAPAFEREQPGRHPCVVGRDGLHVVGAHAGGEQRLVGVAHRGIGQQDLRLRLHPFREAFGTEFLQPVAATGRDRCIQVAMGPDRFRQGERRQFAAFHLRITVDGHVAEELDQAAGAVASLGKMEEFRRLINEACRAFARQEQGVLDDVFEELQVGGQAAYPELTQRAAHAACSLGAAVAPGGDLDEQ